VTAAPHLPSTSTMMLIGLVGLGFFAYRGTKKGATLAATLSIHPMELRSDRREAVFLYELMLQRMSLLVALSRPSDVVSAFGGKADTDRRGLTQNKTRYRQRTRTGFVAIPYGFRNDTAPSQKPFTERAVVFGCQACCDRAESGGGSPITRTEGPRRLVIEPPRPRLGANSARPAPKIVSRRLTTL
jgi:hypothetical protein